MGFSGSFRTRHNVRKPLDRTKPLYRHTGDANSLWLIVVPRTYLRGNALGKPLLRNNWPEARRKRALNETSLSL